MKQGSTLFLKIVIYLIGLAVLALTIIILGTIIGGRSEIFLPILLGVLFTIIPFFMALYNGHLLLRNVDQNTAFSVQSVKALQMIKYSSFAISVIYALMLPYIVNLAHTNDAPGVVLLGLVFMLIPLIVSTFAAVLEKLLQTGMHFKSENDLTV